MIVRELLTRIGFTVDKKGEKQGKKAFAGLKKAAGELGIALSVGAVAIGFKKILDSASDVEETMNVVTTLFEDQTDVVLNWAKTFGEAAGRSQFTMREYAAQIGQVVAASLDNAEATTEMSTRIAEATVDLASFNNETEADTLVALRAGLIGSFEPLQRFGVVLNVAALEAFALEQGFKKSFKEMSAGEKITVRYQAIMAQAAKKMGDATKTAGGFANQSKRLWGNIRDLAVNIGQELLPGVTSLLTGFNRLLSVIKGPLTLTLRALLNVFKFIGATVGGIALGFSQLGVIGSAAVVGLTAKVLIAKGAISAVTLGILKLKLVAFAGFILMAVAIAGLIIIIDDLWAGITKGEGVLAGLVKNFQALAEENDSYLTATRLTLQTALDHWIWYFTGVEHGSFKMGEAIRGFFRGIGDFMAETIELSNQRIMDTWAALSTFIIEKMQAVVDFLTDTLKPITDGIVEGMTDLVGLASDLGLGDLAKTFGFAGPTNIAAPGSPAARAAAARAGDVNARQSIEVNVNATGGDPKAIAGAVAPAVGRAAGDANRQTAQQLLAGGATP